MREYRSAVMDNGRWTGFEPREGDVFVCTPSKCGTTWMQTIVANLFWPNGGIPAPIFTLSPWIEAKFIPAEAMHQTLRDQTHRRAMKSHTPADGIPWFAQAKYVVVGRDGRDAFMSWCNHVQRMKIVDMLNDQAAKEGLSPLRKFDGDYHAFFRHWLNDNNYFEVVASYWERRNEPNVLFVHYNDMKVDLAGEMRRVADYLDIHLTESQWRAVVYRCTFDGMRRADKEINDFSRGFDGGIEGFLFKGTNGRWRDVLDAADLAAYQATAAEALSPAAARWAEHGGHALEM